MEKTYPKTPCKTPLCSCQYDSEKGGFDCYAPHLISNGATAEDYRTALDILKGKFIINGKTYYEWPNINRMDIRPKIIEAMQEYASLQSSQVEPPITINKSDGTGTIEITPQVKSLAISWIENYIPNGSMMPEIAQKWKLAEDIQRIVNSEKANQRNEVIEECKSEVNRFAGDAIIINSIKETLEKLKSPE